MKKAEIITAINEALTANPDLDYDLVAEDAKTKVKDLKDLLSDINDDIAEAAKPPVVKLADLCKEAGKDPKTVRARMRRLYSGDDAKDLPQPIADAGQRWTYNETDREAVMSLITE